MSINVSKDDASKCMRRVGVTPDALPEVRSVEKQENLPSWVSTDCTPRSHPPLSNASPPQWHVLRTTYGQERKAYDYMKSKGVEVFLPTERVVRLVKGKRKQLEVSLIPNIFFAFGTEEELKAFVFDNINLPFLRFYYRSYHEGSVKMKVPLVVPHSQMRSFQIVCEASDENTIVSTRVIPRFKRGELVRVVEGRFAGVVGRVVKYKAQQRVGMIIDGLVSIATAYVPDAFLERIEEVNDDKDDAKP